MCMFKSGDLKRDVLYFCRQEECKKLPSTLSELDGLCNVCEHNVLLTEMQPILRELKKKIVQYNVMNVKEEAEVEKLINESVKKGKIFMQKSSSHRENS